ncbi:MAG: tetratricopeptide repeat protein [Nitrospinae bacterium]|nr:tetratricopeptide repeat protein [Nitrospinota bacterium]
MAEYNSETESLPLYKQQLIKKYKSKLDSLLEKYPHFSYTFSDIKLNNNITNLLMHMGVKPHTINAQSSDTLMKYIPLWLFNKNLVLFHYKVEKKEGNIINILRAIKRHVTKVPFENLVPVFFSTLSEKKQIEIFRLLGGFGIKHVIFLTPNTAVDTTIEELFEELSLLNEKIESEKKKKPAIDTALPPLANLDQYKDYVLEAESLMENGKFEKAIEIFTKAIDLNPDFDSLLHRGDAYYKSKQFMYALQDYREASKLHQKESEPLAKMSSCCFKLVRDAVKSGNTEKAKQFVAIGMKAMKNAKEKVDEFIKKNSDKPELIPEHPYKDVFASLIDSDVRGLGMYEVEDELNKLTQVVMQESGEVNYLDSSIDIDIRIDYAILLTRNKEYEKAEHIFRKIIKENPDSVGPAFNNFAVELRKNGNNGKAFEVYSELVRFPNVPDKEIIVENLKIAGVKFALELRDDFKMEKAINVYKIILSNKPKGKEWVLCECAMAFLETQDQANASSRLMEAIYINPTIVKSQRLKQMYPDLLNLQEEMVKKLTLGLSM